jgi:integrase
MFKKVAAKALQKLEDQKPEEERGEIKKITFHSLLHTNVTLLMTANIHSLKISRWVGHADTQLVDKIYAHVYKDAQGEIVGQIERDLFAAQ